ncbi:MAG: hypothetical protein K6G62_01190, partial [Eubacterium sp.]|nr:hypothetical protein [Eubacterium sp.]
MKNKIKTAMRASIFLALLVAVGFVAVPQSKAAATAENNYKQGKVYKIGPKSKPYKKKKMKSKF